LISQKAGGETVMLFSRKELGTNANTEFFSRRAT
jgi:hypothetical protein